MDEVPPVDAFAPIPVVLQFALVPTPVPDQDPPVTESAFVHVPVVVVPPVETEHPARQHTFVDPLPSVEFAMLVQPEGKLGTEQPVPSLLASTIRRSPVFEAENVPLVEFAATDPVRPITP